MDEIVKEFLIESRENLDRLDQELVRLESDPSSKELLASIFRTLHTIKGSCGFLGFQRLQKVTHSGEGLLARLRDGEITLNQEITSALLALVDAVRSMLACINASGQDGEQDFAALIDRLGSLQEPATAPKAQLSANCSEIDQPDSASRPNAEPAAAGTSGAETIRVGVKVLDRLMNLVGELVLARNRLLQSHPEEPDGGFEAATQRLNLITTELQDEVMKTRLQPISTVWNKFPRTVRDLALACAKQVRLEMQGEDVELDRTILETIRDPLLHLVRNAIDHGIEMPEVRQQAGKSPAGTLTLRAFHEPGRVNLEVSDDGAGLNRERISEKAIERGLVSAAQTTDMPDRDVFQLIFRPGFSTAERVTHISGRGVGMDVVKTNVEAIGGMVEVNSVAGRGATFMIRLPLTVAIMPALMVRSGGERFAIPQVNLVELIRHEAGNTGRIEKIQGTPVYRLRGLLLPLLSLNGELQLANANGQGDDAAVSIVMVRADKREFGVIVDEIMDTQEIVVKPLDRQLMRIGIYAGATILGDGRVALILDIHGLAQRAGLMSTKAESTANGTDNAHPPTNDVQRPASLIVQCPDHRPRAIPLSSIWRLEEICRASIEMLGGQEVIQCDGEIIPLLRLGDEAVTAIPSPNIPLPVVLCRATERKIGLVVERFLDIAEEGPLPQHVASDGLLQGTVIQGKVTELLDVPRLARESFPELVPARGEAAGA